MPNRRPIVPGPTYAEMRDPALLPAALRARARAALKADEMNLLNLFNITWKREDGSVNYLVLPRELTGVRANVIVLLAKDFPSGSHKVGPAYTTLMEAEAMGEIRPGEKTVIGPSTGNFGIGTAYISSLKGYESLVVMPDSMSAERYERIRKYGGGLDLTPGTESDVILTLERTHQVYMRNPHYKVLAQFELLPNYRFHRYVTGDACLKAAQGVGNGRIAAFVSAPGSAGTLAAADHIREVYPDCAVVAVEPRECATLFRNGRGQHRIEGIGDKMVTLIHNVLNTDYVMLVHDDDCVKGLKVIQDGQAILVERLGVPPDAARRLWGAFGISSICNIIAALKTAKMLDLGRDDNIVTIATDGFDRYPSVMADLERRVGAPDADIYEMWAKGIFLGATTHEILDVRPAHEKERLFRQKEEVWTQFGYSQEYLNRMKYPDFWEAETAKIPEVDTQIAEVRGSLE
jgi:cysteine synthase A